MTVYKIKEIFLKQKSNTSLLTLFLRLIGIVFIFLTTFIFTNNFDSDIVGLYDFSRSYLLVFGSISMLASDQTILYLVGRYNNNKESIKDIYLKIFLLCLFIYLLTIGLYFIINYYGLIQFDNKTNLIILKSNLILIFYSIYLINAEIFRALNYTVISETFRNIIKYIPLLLGFIFVGFFENPYIVIDFFIFGFIFISIISSLVLFFTLKKQKSMTIEGYKKDTFKFIIKYSIPITISTVSIYLLSSIDIFYIKYFYGDKFVAYYSVAVKIISIINVSINAISLSVASGLAYNYTNKNFDVLKKITRKSSRLIFFFSLTVSCIIYIFSKKILDVFGNEYIISNTTLIILLIGNLIMSIAGNTYMYLLMTNKGIVLGKLLILAVVINLISNYFVIPIYGIEGAAFTSVISIILWNFLGAYFIYKKDKINILFKLK